jgi:hypothetical protein
MNHRAGDRHEEALTIALSVIPAKAGIQVFEYLDARLRGHDE